MGITRGSNRFLIFILRGCFTTLFLPTAYPQSHEGYPQWKRVTNYLLAGLLLFTHRKVVRLLLLPLYINPSSPTNPHPFMKAFLP